MCATVGVDCHRGRAETDVLEKCGVVENRDGRLTVEKHPCVWDGCRTMGEREFGDSIGRGHRCGLEKLNIGGSTWLVCWTVACVVSSGFAAEAGDVAMGDSVRPSDLCKSHAELGDGVGARRRGGGGGGLWCGRDHRCGCSARGTSVTGLSGWGNWFLVVKQQVVCCGEVHGVLVLASAVVVFQFDPQLAISAGVGTLEERQGD